MGDKLVLFAAQGFGIGLLPKAQGTFGTLLGFLWVGLLIATGNFYLFWIGCIAGIGFAVYASGRAENILRRQDPPSVVIDEIAAFPLCFLNETLVWHRAGYWPSIGALGKAHFLVVAVIAFVLFRIFDIWKPGPIRASQHLIGGWGVVVDDVLAALLVGLLMLAAATLFRLP